MIITIARQLGSGGEDVGLAVAKQLGVAYLDREILLRAAQTGALSAEALAGDDERPPTLLERIADYSIRVSGPWARTESGMEDLPVVSEGDHESHRHLVEKAIRQIAQEGSAVIVGRGAQVILRDNPQALHVFIHAPEEVRVRRLADREGIAAAEARRRVRESDRNRAGYLKSGYGVDWHDPGLYDLAVNTGRLGEDAAVELIVRSAQAISARAGSGA